MDTLAEKYAALSPYEYVGGNPIKRIDPDGMDWDIDINHDEESITISANYDSFNADDETMEDAANVWTAQSGEFTYEVDG